MYDPHWPGRTSVDSTSLDILIGSAGRPLYELPLHSGLVLRASASLDSGLPFQGCPCGPGRLCSHDCSVHSPLQEQTEMLPSSCHHQDFLLKELTLLEYWGPSTEQAPPALLITKTVRPHVFSVQVPGAWVMEEGGPELHTLVFNFQEWT